MAQEHDEPEPDDVPVTEDDEPATEDDESWSHLMSEAGRPSRPARSVRRTAVTALVAVVGCVLLGALPLVAIGAVFVLGPLLLLSAFHK